MREQLHAGMTAAELIELMGEPAFVAHEPDAESWIYQRGGSEIRVRLITVVSAVFETPPDDGET